jgi:hypothetical protein
VQERKLHATFIVSAASCTFLAGISTRPHKGNTNTGIWMMFPGIWVSSSVKPSVYFKQKLSFSVTCNNSYDTLLFCIILSSCCFDTSHESLHNINLFKLNVYVFCHFHTFMVALNCFNEIVTTTTTTTTTAAAAVAITEATITATLLYYYYYCCHC